MAVVQEYFRTGMYVINKDFRIVSINSTMRDLYPTVQVGDHCYRSIALQTSQCDICPLKTDNITFYNPLRRSWVHANATVMDYPGCGECYTVQFQIRESAFGSRNALLEEEAVAAYIRELSGGSTDVCAIAGYCEPGSPLAYASAQLVERLGYESLEQLYRDVDGLVSNTIHPEDLDAVTQDLTHCAQHGGSFESHYRIHRRDNSWIPVVSRGTRIQTAGGSHVLLCVLTEPAELARQQAELTRQKIQFDMVTESIPCGYHRCTVDNGFRLEFVSDNFLEIMGCVRREELLGKPFLDFVAQEDRTLFMSHEPTLAREGRVELVYRIRRRDGKVRWVKDSTMRIPYNGKDTYQCILVDITEHVESLNEARAQAEASNQAKSAFLFNASHDIRTPMNAIQGFAHIIEENAGDAALVLENVRKLRQSGDILRTLMDDVLELSRIEQGKETVNRQPLNMLTHLEKLYEMMVPGMQSSELDFRMENRIQHPLVFADELKLNRIAMNFLSNARKFTPAGGRVCFGVEESACNGETADYTLFVQDTGIGMSRQFQEHAFEQFERERTSTASGVTGSGLGLSITKKLADLLGATCGIESELGKGTRMTCRVTLHLAREADFKPEGDSAAVDLSGRRVLLVEDNDFNREIARYVFEAMDLLVVEACNGEECLEALTAAPAGYFDFILMDVQMPVMDGYQATKAIRSHSDRLLAGIPIIAMTANAFEEDRQRCLAVGMDGHIAKPMNAGAVHKELARVLAKGGGKR